MRRLMRLTRCPNGFGLLELLIVLMIISLAMIAVTPGVHSYWRRQQLTRVSWDIVSLLQFAQTLAQTQQRSVVLCGSREGRQCGAPWSQGLLMFYGHDTHVVDPTEIIRFYANPHAYIDIQWRGFQAHDYIRFDVYGMGQTLNGRFRLTQASGQQSRCLVMNRIGRVRVEEGCST